MSRFTRAAETTLEAGSDENVPGLEGMQIAIDANGKVVENLQDPAGAYPINTTAVETEDYLYIGSLVAPNIARLAL